MPRSVTVYDADDLIDATELADYFGYSRDHIRNMLNINDNRADPKLIRLRIRTSPEWRRENGSRAMWVYRFGDVQDWYQRRQRSPHVRRAQGRRTTKGTIDAIRT